MRGTSKLVMGTVLIVALAATPAGAAKQKPSRHPKQPSILLVGDSLGAFSAPDLHRELSGWRFHVHARYSINAPQGARTIAGYRKRHELSKVISPSLGTNDYPQYKDRFKEAVDLIMASVNGRCVIWPDIYRGPINGVSYSGFNQILRDAARAHRNLRIVPWDKMVRHHQRWLLPDKVHVDEAGNRARARAIATRARRCLHHQP